MKLYLHENLIKAGPNDTQPIPGRTGSKGPTTEQIPGRGAGGAAPAVPKTNEQPAIPQTGSQAAVTPSEPPGDPSSQAQPCSQGGGKNCSDADGDGADTHKLDSGIEQLHAAYKARQGAGASKEETAEPAVESTPEAAKEAADAAAPSINSVSANKTQGVTSINPEDYPEDSQAIDHYKIAAHLESQGGGNDSSKELAGGHREIARQRSAEMSSEEHDALAQELHAGGFTDDAKHHERQAGEGRAAEQSEFKDSVDSEFDQLIDSFDDKEKARDTAKRALEDLKAKNDPETGSWSEENHEVHKKKKKSHEAKMHDHSKKKPRKPAPFTDKGPDPDNYAEDGVAFKAAQKDHGKKKKAADTENAKHKKDTHTWQQKDQDLKDEYSDFNEADKDFDEAAGERDNKAKQDAADKKDADKQAATAAKDKSKADADKPRAPESDLDHAAVASHKAEAQKAHSNMQSWLDGLDDSDDFTDEEKNQLRTKLEMAQKGLQSHMDLQDVPTKDHKAEMKEYLKIAGEHGKKPPEQPKLQEGADEPDKAKPKKTNLMGAFESGRRFGTKIGRAAATGEMAGTIGSEILNYGGTGVVSAGHSLLDKKRTQSDAADKTAKKTAKAQKAAMKAADKKGSPATEGEKAAKKSLTGLYLDSDASMDLLKAVQIPNTATSTDSGKTAQKKFKASYANQPVGVMGGAGIAMEDDPDVGRKWKHDPEDSVAAEIEEDNEFESEDEKKVQKSFLVDDMPSGLSMLRDMNKSWEQESSSYRYNPRELEFMTDVLGVSKSEIRKGMVRIVGKNRHRFHEWLLERMNTSVDVMGDNLG